MTLADTALLRARLEREVNAALDSWQETDWRWGVFDCAHAIGDILRPILGYDPIELFRGRYSTKLGYARILKREGFADVDEALRGVAFAKNWRGIASADALPGDVGTADHPEARAIVINNGAFWYAPRSRGFVAIPAAATRCAFSVL